MTLSELEANVRAAFPDSIAGVYAAPGRVNLMGDHTDYNDGFVLPMAIDRWCVVGLERATDGAVRASSSEAAGKVAVPADGSRDPRRVEPAWGRFVAGVVRALVARGAEIPGARLRLSSSVPLGSGLSSSSAFAVALTLALADVARFSVDGVGAARLALAAEVEATDVPGGLMDQLAAIFGRRDHALLIDCRGPVIEPVPIAGDVAVLVVHSGLPRRLADSSYAARRAECEAVAARLGVRALRDATPDQVADEPRARHVVAENARVHDTAAALSAGDLDALGALFLASHASLRDDYRVSTRELDVLVDALVESGAAGARLTGAGFGGCVVAVSARNDADRVLERAIERYRTTTSLEPSAFVARAVDGAATSARGAVPSSARTRRR
jgi:galactokinase